MLQKTSASLFFIMYSCICLLILSYWHSNTGISTFGSCNSAASGENTSVIDELNTLGEDSNTHHHGRVQGKPGEFEKIADLSDKGGSLCIKYFRIYKAPYFREAKILSSLHIYTCNLLNSSHLAPSTTLRI